MSAYDIAKRLQKLGAKVFKRDNTWYVQFNGHATPIDDQTLDHIIDRLVSIGYNREFLEIFLGKKQLHPFVTHLVESTLSNWDVILPEDVKRLGLPPKQLLRGNTLLAFSMGDTTYIRFQVAFNEALKEVLGSATHPSRQAILDTLERDYKDLLKFHRFHGPGLRGNSELFVEVPHHDVVTDYALYVDELVRAIKEILSTTEVAVSDEDVIKAMAKLIEAGIITADGGIKMERFKEALEEAKREVPSVR